MVANMLRPNSAIAARLRNFVRAARMCANVSACIESRPIDWADYRRASLAKCLGVNGTTAIARNVVKAMLTRSRSRCAANFVRQRAVGQSFRKMYPADAVGAVEVRQRARDAQHAVIAARRELH